jgi:hypothetical protein
MPGIPIIRVSRHPSGAGRSCRLWSAGRNSRFDMKVAIPERSRMMSYPSEVPLLLPGAGSRAVACHRSGYVDDRAWSKSLLGAGPYGGSCTSLEDSVSVHRDGVMRRSSANP